MVIFDGSLLGPYPTYQTTLNFTRDFQDFPGKLAFEHVKEGDGNVDFSSPKHCLEVRLSYYKASEWRGHPAHRFILLYLGFVPYDDRVILVPSDGKIAIQHPDIATSYMRDLEKTLETAVSPKMSLNLNELYIGSNYQCDWGTKHLIMQYKVEVDIQPVPTL